MGIGVGTAIIIAGTVAAGAMVGSSAYAAHEEEKQQNKLLAAQREATAKAEAKVANAQSLAQQEAKEKLRKQRLAQTNTILTSPLGIIEEATTIANTLGG